MARHSKRPYSYRFDPDVPRFDDSRPLFVFDGTCVLCSGGARWIMALDRKGRVAFTSAQGPIGSALYRHYGMAIDETYLLIDRGHAYGSSGGYMQLLDILGGPWRLLKIFGVVPERWRDRGYQAVARNRYRWFGKAEECALLTPEQRSRLVSVTKDHLTSGTVGDGSG